MSLRIENVEVRAILTGYATATVTGVGIGIIAGGGVAIVANLP